MTGAEEPHLWLADPSVDWRIVLTARLARPTGTGQADLADLVEQRLAGLNARLGASEGSGLLRGTATGSELLRAVAGMSSTAPVTAGVGGHDLVLAAEHQYVDGLGLLAVLTEVTGVPAHSAARGLGPRTAPPFAVEVARRLTEVAFRPPARVAPTGGPPTVPGHVPGSAFADLLLDRRVGVTHLVQAAVGAVVELNRARGARTRRVAVAVGASTVGGARPTVADDSALLRLRSAEKLDADALRAFLRSAPVVPSPGRSLENSRSWLTRAAEIGVRVLGPRLGSTLTVSHLGDVTAEVEELGFYPVAGGASAVAIGAVTVEGRTRITARGGRELHSQAGLDELLTAVAAHLG